MEDTFLANIAHETRTLISAIYACTDLLSHNLRGQKEALDLVATIRDNGGHLLHLINNAMEMCKLQAGMMAAHKIDCDPGQLVADVVSLMHSKAAQKDVKIAAECATPIPTIIRTDPTRLRQILINLVDNAIKFTPKGEARLRMTMVDDARDVEGSSICFEVADTGIGITSEQIERIFEPFTQAEVTTSRFYGGSGLGLTISNQLAGLLGGNLRVTSQPNQGSTFTLQIPTGPIEGVALVDQVPQLMLGPQQQKSRASLSMTDLQGRLIGMQVLLIEDRTDNQLLLSVILKSAGAKVSLADSASGAKQMVTQANQAEQPYHAVLLDTQMRHEDGRQVIGELRQQGYEGAVIAVTASETDRDRWIKAGCTESVTVPHSGGNLATEMIRVLAGVY